MGGNCLLLLGGEELSRAWQHTTKRCCKGVAGGKRIQCNTEVQLSQLLSCILLLGTSSSAHIPLYWNHGLLASNDPHDLLPMLHLVLYERIHRSQCETWWPEG